MLLADDFYFWMTFDFFSHHFVFKTKKFDIIVTLFIDGPIKLKHLWMSSALSNDNWILYSCLFDYYGKLRLKTEKAWQEQHQQKHKT